MSFLRFILLVLTSIAIFFFVTAINIMLLFSSSDMVKKIFSDSNLYPVVAAGIRDNIVKYAQVPVDQNQLIEIVTAAISEQTVKSFVEDTTDQFFTAIKTKEGKPKITVHLSSFRDLVASKIGSEKDIAQLNKALGEENKEFNINTALADRDVDLSKNPFVMLLVNIHKYIIGFGIAALVLIILLLLSGTWTVKLIWLGATFIVSGFAFVGELLLYYIGLSDKTITKLAEMSNFTDEKFILGVKKVLFTITDYQKIYYLSITIGLVVLGIILIIIGKSLKKHDQLRNEDKTLPNPPAPNPVISDPKAASKQTVQEPKK